MIFLMWQEWPSIYSIYISNSSGKQDYEICIVLYCFCFLLCLWIFAISDLCKSTETSMIWVANYFSKVSHTEQYFPKAFNTPLWLCCTEPYSVISSYSSSFRGEYSDCLTFYETNKSPTVSDIILSVTEVKVGNSFLHFLLCS